jgi:hypothetical protein
VCGPGLAPPELAVEVEFTSDFPREALPAIPHHRVEYLAASSGRPDAVYSSASAPRASSVKR